MPDRCLRKIRRPHLVDDFFTTHQSPLSVTLHLFRRKLIHPLSYTFFPHDDHGVASSAHTGYSGIMTNTLAFLSGFLFICASTMSFLLEAVGAS